MTDRELVAMCLAFIETRLEELRRLARPAEIVRDVVENHPGNLDAFIAAIRVRL